MQYVRNPTKTLIHIENIDMPKTSVFILVYTAETVSNISAQSYLDFEFLIVNEVSNSDT